MTTTKADVYRLFDRLQEIGVWFDYYLEVDMPGLLWHLFNFGNGSSDFTGTTADTYAYLRGYLQACLAGSA